MAHPDLGRTYAPVHAPTTAQHGSGETIPTAAKALIAPMLLLTLAACSAESPAPAFTSLNFDETSGDKNLQGQNRQVADYLRAVSDLGENATEADLISAMKQIQQEEI